MNVGILSESESDEVGVHLLAEAVTGKRLNLIAKNLRAPTRGWTGIFDSIPAVYARLHWTPDADGLLCVIDSDDTTPHTEEHEAKGYVEHACRYCILRRRLADLAGSMKPRPNNQPLRVAVGLAVPAIEAWYRCGLDLHCTEARYTRESLGGLRSARRQLKIDVYGSPHAPQKVLTQKAIANCERLATNIQGLTHAFPNGFGTFARDLRLW